MPPTSRRATGRLRAIALFFTVTFPFLPNTARAACPVLGPFAATVDVVHAGEPLTDYFALITIDTATPISLGRMRPDAGDLRFADALCSQYDYWIESGLNTASTRVWVVIPSVPAGSSQFFMHYGNAAFTHDNAAANVFGPSVASLYTFGEQDGTVVRDFVGGHDVTADEGLTWTSGPRPGVGAITGFAPDLALRAAGPGVAFGTAPFTVFAVVKPMGDVPSSTQEALLVTGLGDDVAGWGLGIFGGALSFGTSDADEFCQYVGGPVERETWLMAGGRRGNDIGGVLLNGAPLDDFGSCPDEELNVDGSEPVKMGNFANDFGDFPLLGLTSLTVMYTSALDDDAAAALYASLLPPVHPTIAISDLAEAPAITSADQAAFTIAAAGAFTYTATGSPPPTITLQGALPAGLTFDGATAVLSGTPQAGTAGTYALTVHAANGVAPDATQGFTLTINRVAQTIAFTAPGPAVAGASVALEASASSGLPVTFTSSTPAVCTIAGATATLLLGGTCTVVAIQPGDATYLPAADVTQSFFVSPAAPGAPEPPDAFTATAQGNAVSFAWTPAAGRGAELYLVEVGDVPGRTTVTSALTRATRVIGLLPSGEYYVRVRGVNGQGLGPASADARLVVSSQSAVAGPPVGFAARVAADVVDVTWQPAMIGAEPTGYLLEVGGDFARADIGVLWLPAGTRSLHVTGVPPGAYVLRVRALTGAGASLPSNDVRIRVGPPAACADPPSGPILLTPVVAGHIVSLAWLPGAGAERGFVLQAGSSPGASDLAVIDLGAVTGIGAAVGDGSYAVRVVPQSDCGVGAASADTIVTVGGQPPSLPSDLAATFGPGGVTFTWTPPASGPVATHYVLEAGVAPGTTLIKFPVGSTPSLTIPGIPFGITFVARVRGANASGIGAASSEIVVSVP